MEKERRYSNQNILKAVRKIPCVSCGLWWSEAAHADMQEFGKGMGRKASDAAVMALCQRCHIDHGNGNKISKKEKRESTYEFIVHTYDSLFSYGYISLLPENISDKYNVRDRAHQLVRAFENKEIKLNTNFY